MSNSGTFKDLYKNSRTFQAWNPNFQIPGLSRFSRTCANPGIFDEFMVNKYIFNMVWYWNEFLRMLTFALHVSADAHWYLRFVITLPTYFRWLSLLYNVSAEANCFLRFIVIKYLFTKLILKCFARWTEGGSTSANAVYFRLQHMRVDAVNIVYSWALCIWFS